APLNLGTIPGNRRGAEGQPVGITHGPVLRRDPLVVPARLALRVEVVDVVFEIDLQPDRVSGGGALDIRPRRIIQRPTGNRVRIAVERDGLVGHPREAGVVILYPVVVRQRRVAVVEVLDVIDVYP